jgi:hypothetical protein
MGRRVRRIITLQHWRYFSRTGFGVYFGALACLLFTALYYRLVEMIRLAVISIPLDAADAAVTCPAGICVAGGLAALRKRHDPNGLGWSFFLACIASAALFLALGAGLWIKGGFRMFVSGERILGLPQFLGLVGAFVFWPGRAVSRGSPAP